MMLVSCSTLSVDELEVTDLSSLFVLKDTTVKAPENVDHFGLERKHKMHEK
jgi:hypothetical protein